MVGKEVSKRREMRKREIIDWGRLHIWKERVGEEGKVKGGGKGKLWETMEVKGELWERERENGR